MPTPFIISPLEDTDFRVDVTCLVEEVHARWPSATVQFNTEPDFPILCYWDRNVARGYFLCQFFRTQNALSLEGGSVEDHAETAVWFRGLVPSKYRLYYYCSEAWPEKIELLPDTTMDQIAASMGHHF